MLKKSSLPRQNAKHLCFDSEGIIQSWLILSASRLQCQQCTIRSVPSGWRCRTVHWTAACMMQQCPVPAQHGWLQSGCRRQAHPRGMTGGMAHCSVPLQKLHDRQVLECTSSGAALKHWMLHQIRTSASWLSTVLQQACEHRRTHTIYLQAAEHERTHAWDYLRPHHLHPPHDTQGLLCKHTY